MTLKLLSDAMKERKGDIRVLVVGLGELKSGTTKSGDPFTKQDATIKDKSGAMTIQLWNDDIGKLISGKFYEIANPYWQEYKGKTQLTLGNYAQIAEIEESELLPYEGEVQASLPVSTAAPTRSQSGASDEEKLDFAETSLIRFINVMKENDIDPLKAVEQFGTVWNTAIMHKK